LHVEVDVEPALTAGQQRQREFKDLTDEPLVRFRAAGGGESLFDLVGGQLTEVLNRDGVWVGCGPIRWVPSGRNSTRSIAWRAASAVAAC
jgi:hypothetical protein